MPVLLDADEVLVWNEGDLTVVLLRGQVLLRQAGIQLRCLQGVAWVDRKQLKTTGIWHVEFYGDGEVHLTNSLDVKEGARALIDIRTRGEVKLNSHVNKVVQQPQPNDPVVQRARAERLAAAPSGIQPASLKPAGPVVPALPPPLPPQPLDPNPSWPVPMVPPATPTPPPVTPLAPPTLTPIPTTPPAGPGTGVKQTSFQTSQPAADGSTPDPPGTITLVQQGLPGPPAPLVPVAPAGTLPAGSLPAGSPMGTPSSPSLAPVTPPAPAGSVPVPLPPPSRPATRPPAAQGSISSPNRQYSISPRSAAGFEVKSVSLGDNEQATIVTGGVILNIRNIPGIGLLDIEADKLVVFSKGNNSQIINNMRQPEGQTANNNLEFYLAGNVEIRSETLINKQQNANPTATQTLNLTSNQIANAGVLSQTVMKESRILRAAEVYLDVNRNVAVALKTQLEIKQPKLPDPVFINAEKLLQTSETTRELIHAEIFSSKLPSDPGLKIYVSEAILEDKEVPQRGFLGYGPEVVDRKTGQPIMRKESIITGKDTYYELQDVPFFYLPYFSADARDPLGPVNDFDFGWNRVFGVQLGFSVNMFDTLGIQRPVGTRWIATLDYLTSRGPGLGTTFNYGGMKLYGTDIKYDGLVKGYTIYDMGTDILGGGRVSNFVPDNERGRALWRQQYWDIPGGFTVQTQLSYLSDHNFLEQYFKNEYDNDLNQNDYLYVKQQDDHSNWAWTGTVGARLRDWVTETIWLPKGDGYLIGQSLFDWFTYNAHASAGYGQLRITTVTEPNYPARVVSPLTDRTDYTGRFDFMQEVSMPLQLGPVKMVPYIKFDGTEYTQDVNGDTTGRIWGAAGVRGSMPLSRLYPEIQSDLFNVNGINHKIVLGANYEWADSNERYTTFGQLDRFNDDASDQAVRDMRNQDQMLYGKATGFNLQNNPLFDPQIYAIRRLIDDHVDTLDRVQVLQLDVLQRWQTKRGYPGMEHVVDWMTLDLSASVFPEPNRDNFGSTFAFLEYDWLWNIGDRTALTSQGWYDPISGGARVFNVGAYYNRNDRTTMFVGFRYIDPLDSRAVTASLTYVFSPKYSVTANSTYDFGTSQALTNGLILTRVGKDLQVSMGLTYNALQNTTGFVFEVVPNLYAASQGGQISGYNSMGTTNASVMGR